MCVLVDTCILYIITVKIPSKLEVAPNALKMWDWTGVDGWMYGYPLDCYDYSSTFGAKNVGSVKKVLPGTTREASCRPTERSGSG